MVEKIGRCRNDFLLLVSLSCDVESRAKITNVNERSLQKPPCCRFLVVVLLFLLFFCGALQLSE